MLSFHNQTIKEVIASLNGNISGLNPWEREERRKKIGYNRLPSKKPVSPLVLFLSQFNNSLVYILLFAGLASLMFNDLVDAAIIFIAIFLNTIIGFVQEKKANDTLDKLKNYVANRSVIVINNEIREINSEEIVPGDIIMLRVGDRLPADARLIEANNIQVDEAILTGESMPAVKQTDRLPAGASLADMTNMVFAGTLIVSGLGRAIVTATGAYTELGKITHLSYETHDEQTPLQKKLSDFSRILGFIYALLTLVVVIIGVVMGKNIFDMFLTGVALACAAIPEGLNVAVTVILAIGMQKILKQKVLTRRLVATETLGSTTVICTDKTGTLTEGRMELSHLSIGRQIVELSPKSTFDNDELLEVVKVIMLCNQAYAENTSSDLAEWRFIGLPTDIALLRFGMQFGFTKQELANGSKLIFEQPFDNSMKRMLSLYENTDGSVLYQKGAPEMILDNCDKILENGRIIPIDESIKLDIKNIQLKYTDSGLRVLALAKKTYLSGVNIDNDKLYSEAGLIFVGLVALKDPLRSDARETVEKCQKAGIRLIIITGDHPLTAQAIAKEIGIETTLDDIMTGHKIDETDDDNFFEAIKHVKIFARVSPHHKLRIVKALQGAGEVVAMVGDGINDAPAIKASDIGVCLGSGSDATKESSDLVLLDNDLSNIVFAVKEGRVIFSNIRKLVTFLLSDNFSHMILIAGSIILGLPLAMLPIQILWLNLVQDGLPSFALAKEEGDDELMTAPIVRRNESIFNKEMLMIIFGVGIVRDLAIFGIFIFAMRFAEIDYIRTLIFAILGTNSLFNILSVRSLSRPIWEIPVLSNRFMVVSIGLSFLMLLAGVYLPFLSDMLHTVPLDAFAWIIIILISVFNIMVIEAVKYFSTHWRTNRLVYAKR